MAATLNKKWDLGLPDELPRVLEGSSRTMYSSKDVEVTEKTTRLVRDFYREDYERWDHPVVG